jgi:hypothetical protein
MFRIQPIRHKTTDNAKGLLWHNTLSATIPSQVVALVSFWGIIVKNFKYLKFGRPGPHGRKGAEHRSSETLATQNCLLISEY